MQQKKEEFELCNHDLNDINNTLEKINKVNMIFPKVTYYICKHCHKIIKL